MNICAAITPASRPFISNDYYKERDNHPPLTTINDNDEPIKNYNNSSDDYENEIPWPATTICSDADDSRSQDSDDMSTQSSSSSSCNPSIEYMDVKDSATHPQVPDQEKGYSDVQSTPVSSLQARLNVKNCDGKLSWNLPTASPGKDVKSAPEPASKIPITTKNTDDQTASTTPCSISTYSSTDSGYADSNTPADS